MGFNNSAITCSNGFTVQMDKSAFEATKINIENVYASFNGTQTSNPACQGTIDGDGVTFSFPFTSCATFAGSNQTHLFYANKLNGASTKIVNSV